MTNLKKLNFIDMHPLNTITHPQLLSSTMLNLFAHSRHTVTIEISRPVKVLEDSHAKYLHTSPPRYMKCDHHLLLLYLLRYRLQPWDK